MIFFGTGSATLSTVKTRNTVCQHCKNEDSLYITIYRRHAHIFWIPVFPLGKNGNSYCSHCKEVLSPKQMPETLKMQYKYAKDHAKGPLWQFAGIGVLVCLIAFAAYAGGKDKENTEKYINEPAVGDVYEYKATNGNYSTMKLRSITEDSLFLSLNDFEIAKRTRIYKIDKEENYPKTTYGYSREEIKEMKNDGIVLDVNRD